MEYVDFPKYKHAHGTNKYKRLANGTCYDIRTPDNLVRALEQCREARTRIRIFLGDQKTGREWHEEFETIGRIDRSTGNIKVPLLIQTSRSTGGGAILDHCILKIVNTTTGGLIYQHPKFKPTIATLKPSKEPGYTTSVYLDAQIHANCRSEAQAQRLADFMTGKRNSK